MISEPAAINPSRVHSEKRRKQKSQKEQKKQKRLVFFALPAF
jgi:hypothetical protein